MEAFIIGIILVSICFLIFGLICLKDAQRLKNINKQELEQYNKQLNELNTSIHSLDNQKSAIQAELQYIKAEIAEEEKIKAKNLTLIEQQKEQVDTLFKKEQKSLDDKVKLYERTVSMACENYAEVLEESYLSAESAYYEDINKIKQEKEFALNELKKVKQTLSAVNEAQIREKEREQKQDFYSLSLEQKDKYEINVIRSIEGQLSDPRPLRMVIWSNYYLKKSNDLSARVLGTNVVTGIYKITNKKTNQCYVGQALDIKTRWRDHMKCGLGIDAPAGNKLYKAMFEDGLESFTFELLEKCPKEQLNEKERFYIDLYDCYNFGYNSNKGIK